MSNVLLKNRGISTLEFYRKANDFRIVATRVLLNDKYVPKHYRFVYSYPMLKLTNKMIRQMRRANDCFPTSEEMAAKRKKHAKKALRLNAEIQDLFQNMLDVLYYKKIDAVHPLPDAILNMIDLITESEKLLDAWRRKTQVRESAVERDFGDLVSGPRTDNGMDGGTGQAL